MPANFKPTEIPTEPGVYRFYDVNDRILYVGKALNLKNRLSSYFQSNLPERTDRMVTDAVRVDWTIVSSEVEALQLEYTWIKEEKPDFNVEFKDDKSYPYLALSMKDEFPRLFITRRSKQKGVVYFGPFAHAWALRSTFDLILKLFPVRSCSQSNFESARRSKRQCLLGDIGKCAAPCVGWVDQEEHRAIAKKVSAFLSDGAGDIATKLRDEMEKAAAKEEYERAGKIRDQLLALERSMESSDAAIPDSISGDFIALHDEITHSAVSLFRIRTGRIIGSRSWIMDRTKSVDEDLFSDALNQRRTPQQDSTLGATQQFVATPQDQIGAGRQTFGKRRLMRQAVDIGQARQTAAANIVNGHQPMAPRQLSQGGDFGGVGEAHDSIV